MDVATYAVEAAVEENHWWFAGRRRLFSDIIRGFDLPRGANILDVGTGTGSNLRLLRNLGFTQITGIDQSLEAIRFCADKGLGTVRLGDVCALPFPDKSFDLVLATDVIEHVEDDLSALRELHRILKPGQCLLLTVPAFPLLWGLQDEVSHHKRRYRLNQLLEKLDSIDLSSQRHFYFNYLLFLPILVCRQLMRILKIHVASEGQINTNWINRVLTLLFRFDVQTAPRLRPPIGVSALVIATRSGSQQPPSRHRIRVPIAESGHLVSDVHEPRLRGLLLIYRTCAPTRLKPRLLSICAALYGVITPSWAPASNR